jgi:hypothetical protein
MTDLSPAAQAVLDAFWEGLDYLDDFTPHNLAAALRAATFQLSFGHATGSGIVCEDDLFAIADELEGAE